MVETIFTIGHSNHSSEKFIGLLECHGITVLCDVRSEPYSRVNPQFNREPLKLSLRNRHVAYVFLGEELGARTMDPSCYNNGRVQYDCLANTRPFRKGLDRVQKGMQKYRLCLMCAEKDPLDCHRAILVARSLVSFGIDVQHILSDGSIESHADSLRRLLLKLHLRQDHLFLSQEDILADAYRIQGERIAFVRKDAYAGEGIAVGDMSQ